MYPDLSYILHDLIGTPRDHAFLSIIKTFGMFLAIAFLAAGFLLYLELRRRERNNVLNASTVTVTPNPKPTTTDLLVSALIGFIVGFKVLFILLNFDAFSADGAGVLFSSQGNVLGGIIGAALWAGYKYYTLNKAHNPKAKPKKMKIYPSDRVGDIVIVAAVSGILGAKIFALIEEPAAFAADPIGMLFSPAGLAIYGGLIGGFVGVYLYVRRFDIPIVEIMDATAPGLILAYGIGRLGCHFSGDGDWGIPVKGPNAYRTEAYDLSTPPDWLSWLPDWLWKYDYPHNVLNRGVAIPGCEDQYCSVLDIPVFPTSIWEFLMALAIFGILWFLRTRLPVAGMLFFLYVLLNGIERLLIEQVRINEPFAGTDYTQAEMIAVLFIVIGGAGMVYLWQRRRRVISPPS